MKKKKQLRKWVVATVFSLMVVMAFCEFFTLKAAEGKHFDDVESLPFRRVGLVLGAAPRLHNGDISLYFRGRMDAAAQLYKAGKVERLLLSGDSHNGKYNETQAMHDSLLCRGVPDSVMVLDSLGLRTLDSMVRAKKVFGVDTFTIVSQQFHNERALCIASHFGIDAIGLNARNVPPYLHVHGFLRERLARVKLFIDILTDKQPRHLGPSQ